jgi:hypothetical protein
MQTLLESIPVRDEWYLDALANPQHYELSVGIGAFNLYRAESHPQASEAFLLDMDGKRYGKCGYSIERHKALNLIINGVPRV